MPLAINSREECWLERWSLGLALATVFALLIVKFSREFRSEVRRTSSSSRISQPEGNWCSEVMNGKLNWLLARRLGKSDWRGGKTG